MIRVIIRITLFAALFCMPPLWAQAKESKALEPIKHVIIISLENHSFDNLFGFFPGAEGIEQAKDTVTQRDRDGEPYETLPTFGDDRFPQDLPNKPFPIEKYASGDEKTRDLVHTYFVQQSQINKGKMDKFAALSDAGGLTMGYYDGSKLKLWEYAQKYTLADHFFHAAFGGSFLNHMWLVCACTPRYDNPDQDLINMKVVTRDGFAVGTVAPTNPPTPYWHEKKNRFLPLQDMPNIGDRLSEKNISWAWYAGGWDNAAGGNPSKSFQFHHQPFVYFRKYGEHMEGRKHLKDEREFLDALKDGSLPAVSFYKPLGEFNLHPGYADVTSGDEHIGDILEAIEESPVWDSTLVIVTFDENGGYWDHVPPPVFDRWGPGMRVPTIIMSPFARKGYVDKTVYDTTSILKFLEVRFGLEPLGARDRAARDLTNALDMTQGKQGAKP